MIRGFQWDLARQVERFDWLLAQLPRYSDWGYQELHLHLEDAVDYPSLPGVARRDAYSWRQFESLVTAADRRGIKVVPIVNLLGHTQYLIKTPEWRDLNELRADDGSPLPHGQICPSHPRTLEVAHKLIADVAPLCTAGRVHVGLDESFLLGRHPASRKAIAERGLSGYFADYVQQLKSLADGHHLDLAIWADMLALLPDAIPQLPAGITAYDWYYYSFPKHPRFEARNFADYDLVPALKSNGIRYWGCPMNGAFRYEPLPVFGDRLTNALSWWRRCQETNAEGFLVTGWEPNRLAIETTVLVDAAIAGLWLDDEPHDQVTLLRRGIERVYGAKHAADRARLLLACDERAFSGYARWESHQRWNTVHGREGSARYAADERFFQRAATRSLPKILAASLHWRRYLAVRDRLIRQHAGWIQRGRRLLRRNRLKELSHLAAHAQVDLDHFQAELLTARNAAIEMWLSTRRRSQSNPNQRILTSDARRTRKLQQWWQRLSRQPEWVETESPVLGRWQLVALVHTTHPNLQAVVIQTQDENGQWNDCHSRYLIEFRNRAARPRSRIRHWLSFPLESPGTPIRFGARGLGQFSLSDVHLSNGVEERRPDRPLPIRMGKMDDPLSVLEVDRSINRSVWQPVWQSAAKT